LNSIVVEFPQAARAGQVPPDLPVLVRRHYIPGTMPRETDAALPQPVFSEPVRTQDPAGFTVPPGDQKLYTGIEELLRNEVVSFERSRLGDADLYPLRTAWGPAGSSVLDAVEGAGQIVFHALGDSGASMARTFPSEIKVADAITSDFHASAARDRPAFLYDLGDLVYNFGESAYYYDQFYDPYRDYPAPILSIPGNHDSFIVPNTRAGEEPLTIFTRNFCATAPVVTREAGSLHRTAMTQPGVYFALDAPFVRILGLFSNSLEDPGVISSENGRWDKVPGFQLDFLRAQLRRIRTESYKGAVIIAVHHPPFSYAPPAIAPSGKHAGSPVMLGEIDEICAAEKVYPHAFLSGHAHNYQRYTRTLSFEDRNLSVPFIICGSGGHNVSPLVSTRNGQKAAEPGDGMDVSHLDTSTFVQAKGLVLDRHDQSNFGFLRITVSETQLEIAFHPVTPRKAGVDVVTVDLATRAVVVGAKKKGTRKGG
jgi:Calcineurin-like phosphoesterase